MPEKGPTFVGRAQGSGKQPIPIPPRYSTRAAARWSAHRIVICPNAAADYRPLQRPADSPPAGYDFVFQCSHTTNTEQAAVTTI